MGEHPDEDAVNTGYGAANVHDTGVSVRLRGIFRRIAEIRPLTRFATPRYWHRAGHNRQDSFRLLQKWHPAIRGGFPPGRPSGVGDFSGNDVDGWTACSGSVATGLKFSEVPHESLQKRSIGQCFRNPTRHLRGGIRCADVACTSGPALGSGNVWCRRRWGSRWGRWWNRGAAGWRRTGGSRRRLQSDGDDAAIAADDGNAAADAGDAATAVPADDAATPGNATTSGRAGQYRSGELRLCDDFSQTGLQQSERLGSADEAGAIDCPTQRAGREATGSPTGPSGIPTVTR